MLLIVQIGFFKNLHCAVLIAIVFMEEIMGILADKLTPMRLSDEQKGEIFGTIVSRLIAEASIETIYVFGSAAYGHMNQVSDIDIAVIFSTETQLKKNKSVILNKNLFPDIQVDLLFFHKEYFLKKSEVGGVCHEIFNKGNVLYDQTTKV